MPGNTGHLIMLNKTFMVLSFATPYHLLIGGNQKGPSLFNNIKNLLYYLLRSRWPPP